MNNDLISRSALKEIIETYRPIALFTDKEVGKNRMVDYCLAEIDNAPTVEAYSFEQVQELVKLNQQFAQEIESLKRPQGEWIIHNDYHENCRYGCNRCGNLTNIPGNFCPNCGVKMRVNKKETTFDDYLKKQLENPEFRKEWEKLSDEDMQKGGVE